MRVPLKGLHKVRSKGRTYFYAWRGGPRLEGQPGTPEFLSSFQKLTAKPRTEGTLDTLIDLFKSSVEYTRLKPKTRADYDRYLSLIGAEFGDMPIEGLEDVRARGIFKEWRDKMASQPRKADYAWTTLARVLSVAKDRGKLRTNVCERGGRLYESERADLIWTQADLDRLKPECSEALWQVVEMAIWTGQRQGDVLRMAWSQWNGIYLKVRQAKTGRLVQLKAPGPMKAMIGGLTKHGPIMMVTHKGQRPWTSDGFRSSFDKARERAGLVHLNFHDLRGTTVTRLFLSGVTEGGIAAITGHSLRQVSAILDRYLSRTQELADAAMEKLEENVTRTGW